MSYSWISGKKDELFSYNVKLVGNAIHICINAKLETEAGIILTEKDARSLAHMLNVYADASDKISDYT
jgi:hypothetical protein